MSGIYSRWGIEMGSDQNWDVLKNRLSILFGSKYIEVSKSEAELVAFSLGKRLSEVAQSRDFGPEWYIEIEELLDDADTPFELARLVEPLLTFVEPVKARADAIAKIVNDANCGITIISKKDDWLTYPTGEKFLDKKVVEKPLSFLADEPLEQYAKAIEHFSSKKWEECAERVRRTLEEYLRHKLKSKKGLEALIIDLASKLKATSTIPQHLISTTVSILKILDKNFNESSKHHSKTYNEQECEFLIYQAGLLMVLIEKIEVRNEDLGS